MKYRSFIETHEKEKTRMCGEYRIKGKYLKCIFKLCYFNHPFLRMEYPHGMYCVWPIQTGLLSITQLLKPFYTTKFKFNRKSRNLGIRTTDHDKAFKLLAEQTNFYEY